MQRTTVKDLRIKAARLNAMMFGDDPNATERGRPDAEGRFFVQGADARVGGYNLFRVRGPGWDNVLYGRTARELFDLMSAFEDGWYACSKAHERSSRAPVRSWPATDM